MLVYKIIKRLRALSAFIVLVSAASQSHAWLSDNFSRSLVQDIYVFISDQVGGGCWTNLKQSREYAEEKLRSKGFKIKSEAGAEYVFVIHANGFRDKTGWCVCNLSTSLETLVLVDDKMAISATVGEASTVIQTKNNINNRMMDIISELISDL